MMKGKTSRLRRLFCTLLSAVLLLSSVTIPASATDSRTTEELRGYARQLQAGNSGYKYKDNGEVKLGSNASTYALGETSASAGRVLYLLEVRTAEGYTGSTGVYGTDNSWMECVVYYQGSDGYIYWTEPFNFSQKAAGFMSANGSAAGRYALADGGTDILSLSMPSSCQAILGIYFYKAFSSGSNCEWTADYVRVAKLSKVSSSDTSISIGAVKTENGVTYRSYTGRFVAGASNLTELGDEDTMSFFWPLSQTNGTVTSDAKGITTGAAAKGSYILEVVTGEKGYSFGTGTGGTISITYKDTSGKSATETTDFAKALTDLYPDSSVKDAANKNNWKTLPTKNNWLLFTDKDAQGLASGCFGNYYAATSHKQSCFGAYSATCFKLSLPKNIAEITSITLTLANNDTMSVQSIRLIDADAIAENYFNGGLSAERSTNWSGLLVAQTVSKTQTINKMSSWTWSKNSATRTVTGLDSYTYGARSFVYSGGTNIGVSLQFADIFGAGIDALLAKNLVNYGDKDITFGLRDAMKKSYGDDAVKALHNLGAFYKEPMTLEVTYKDTFGCTRRVSVPFMTAYLLNAFVESGGKFTGGSWATWIAGIFQQNETAALSMRLSEYKSLVGVKFTYGSAPTGFTSTNTATIDTANDSIAIENICVYEGVNKTNFKSAYDANKLAIALTTSLTPAYSWSAPGGAQGKTLTSGGAISASLSDESLKSGAPTARSYANKYLVSIKTANIEEAGTLNDVNVVLSYTDTSGAKKTTPAYEMRTLVNAFYGSSYINKSDLETLTNGEQYNRHMLLGGTAAFVIELANVDTVDSITLTLKPNAGGVYDSWQLESVTIYELTSLSQRTGTRVSGGIKTFVTWDRAHNSATTDKVADVRQSVLLYRNNHSKTILFTNYSETGEEIKPVVPTKTEEYLTTLPTEMTYEDTLKDLGLTAVKCNYRVDVEVADLEDAGSTNYFYFQLVFENGTSAVVLANQQLASDSFRQGCTETFRIKTTQNYGNVKAVRIICDASSSTSDVFDKLNISKISVTLSSDSGVSKTWMVENVGWIDITYIDEGEDQSLDGLEGMVDRSVTNAEIVKEFAITRMGTAVDLLFRIKTASTSPGGAGRFQGDNGDRFEVTLVYLDGNGVEQSMKFDLLGAIEEYNDSNILTWAFRPDHHDRFCLTMTDVSSISSLIISRGGTTAAGNWIVESVDIFQIGGLGDVYFSAKAEYYRDPVTSTQLTTSNNAAGVYYTIGPSASVTIPFNENSIDVVEDADSDSAWSAAISRVPGSDSERLNIIVYPAAGGRFSGYSSQLTAAAKYTAFDDDKFYQEAFAFNNRGELSGTEVLYTKAMNVKTISALHSLVLSSSATTDAATIGKVVVQRVRGNVILDTYQFDYGSHNLSTATAEIAPTVLTGTPMYQTLTMQVAEGQSRVLTAESSDVAVALRYTSSLDPENTKTVYQTPYVFLTDAGCTAVREGQILELPFDAVFVDSIVGISVVSTGEPLTFENAVAVNCSGTRGTTGATTLSSASFADSFTAGTFTVEVEASEEEVVPVTFTFTTAAEEVAAGAGTSGKVTMQLNYQGSGGTPHTFEIGNLLRRLSGTPTSGSSVTMRVLLSDLDQLENAVVTVEDSWQLASVSAQLEKIEETKTVSTSVNKAALSGEPLTIDLGGFERHNYIQTFSVTGVVSGESGVYSASSGGTLGIGVGAGDVVTLTPAVTAVGSPATTWTWNASGWDSNLTVHSDGTATFRVPMSWHSPDSATFSVTSDADNRLTVTVTVTLIYVEDDAETVFDPDMEEVIDAAVAGEGEGEFGPFIAE